MTDSLQTEFSFSIPKCILHYNDSVSFEQSSDIQTLDQA